jgi:hypothetical protein
MKIDKIYKEIISAYKNQDITPLKRMISEMYRYKGVCIDSVWFYLLDSDKKYNIRIKHGLYSSTSRLKRLGISEDIFNWLCGSSLMYGN